MEIVNDKALLLRLRDPSKVTSVIPKSKDVGDNKVVVHWGLREAVSLTGGARLKDYGSPVDNHQHIARIFTAITGKHVTGRDIAIMHQATKLARRQTTPLEKDHYIDNMAYVGIEYECAVEEE